ncbi:MAG TPA: phosphoenolpyruvate synthase, partial [Sediminispirochaeta sp.]|nr:phosphoenolpyruvate synthase [Sediminispirochaeta sp.]
MAVIIQEVTGTIYGDYCYPNISGVARSLNFYPIENEKPEDGIVDIAFGLGKTVVDGEISLRFSPAFPKKIIQLSSIDSALKETQKDFYAIDMNPDAFCARSTDGGCLRRLEVGDAEDHGSLKFVASTYDFQNHVLRNGTSYNGRRVLTFSSILKYNMFPLAEVIRTILELGQESINSPVEIEFAVNLDTGKNNPAVFSFLQIRPIVAGSEQEDIHIDEELPEHTLIYSNKSMGNGMYEELQDLVYVKPDTFDPAHTKEMAQMIGRINEEFSKQDRGYILVVSGRLGSSDPWLGIPITWSQISHARVIVEMGLPHFRVDPSQGTHFFQNLTSLQNAYLTINPFIDDGIFNLEYLNELEADFENDFLRRVHFPEALCVKIDGRTSRGLIYYASEEHKKCKKEEPQVEPAVRD